MPQAPRSAPPPPSPVLPGAEVARRMALLADLQEALAARGVRSVLARTWRLVLRYDAGPWEPSGPTDPQLRILAPDGADIATTDGRDYYFASGRQCPAGDPASAAMAGDRSQQARSLRPAALPARPRPPGPGSTPALMTGSDPR